MINDKALKRLKSLVGSEIRVIMADGEETSGILDSFDFVTVPFIVIDNTYTGKKQIINFNYIYSITEKEIEKHD